VAEADGKYRLNPLIVENERRGVAAELARLGKRKMVIPSNDEERKAILELGGLGPAAIALEPPPPD